jgi:hypothetical protein
MRGGYVLERTPWTIVALSSIYSLVRSYYAMSWALPPISFNGERLSLIYKYSCDFVHSKLASSARV